MKALVAQTRAEIQMTLRRGESLVLTLGIPLGLLVFFNAVDIVTVEGTRTVDFLVPGVLALAVMSTSMVSLGIATGFERGYGVLKRLGATPLGRPRLLAAKTASIVVVEIVQVALLTFVGLALGWEPAGGLPLAICAVVTATVAFSGVGLLLAGTLRAETTLAAANALYIVLLLLGGMIVPLDRLPDAARAISEVLPAAAFSEALRAAFSGLAMPVRAWTVLAVWALVSPIAAARCFRWE